MSKTEWKNIIKRLFTGTLVLLVILLFLTIVAPIAIVLFDEAYLGALLDNEYIDQNFVNWKPVHLNETHRFFVPNEWTIHEDKKTGIIYFESENDYIAYGMFVDEDTPRHDGLVNLLSDICSFPVEEVSYEYASDFVQIDCCIFEYLRVSNDEGDARYGYLSLSKDGGSKFLIIFPWDGTTGDCQLITTVQAIAFSYRYPQ